MRQLESKSHSNNSLNSSSHEVELKIKFYVSNEAWNWSWTNLRFASFVSNYYWMELLQFYVLAVWIERIGKEEAMNRRVKGRETEFYC